MSLGKILRKMGFNTHEWIVKNDFRKCVYCGTHQVKMINNRNGYTWDTFNDVERPCDGKFKGF